MPSYDYQCIDCNEIYSEYWLSFAEVEQNEPEFLEKATCPKCSSVKKLRLVGGGSMIELKGGGWTNKTITTKKNRNEDSTARLRDRSKQIKEETKNLTSKDFYGDIKI